MAVLAHSGADPVAMRRKRQMAASRIDMRCGTSLCVKERDLVVPFEVCAEAAYELKRLEQAMSHQKVLQGLF